MIQQISEKDECDAAAMICPRHFAAQNAIPPKVENALRFPLALADPTARRVAFEKECNGHFQGRF
jgi:hypothetical protein